MDVIEFEFPTPHIQELNFVIHILIDIVSFLILWKIHYVVNIIEIFRGKYCQTSATDILYLF